MFDYVISFEICFFFELLYCMYVKGESGLLLIYFFDCLSDVKLLELCDSVGNLLFVGLKGINIVQEL